MRGKRYKYIVCAVIAVLLLAAAAAFLNRQEKDAGISRALAAKALALAAADKKACEALIQAKPDAFDGDKGQWYAKYMGYVYDKGWFDEAEMPADDKGALLGLTYGELEGILRRMSVETDLPKRRSKKAVETDVWWSIYQAVLLKYDTEHEVREQTLVVYGTPANLEQVPAWTAYTDLGKMGFEGVGLDACIDRQVAVLERNGEILTVMRTVSDQVTYENVWIVNATDKQADIFYDGFYRTLKSGYWGADGEPESQEGGFGQVVGDVVLDKGVLTGIRVKEETIRGKVLAVKDDSIEIEGYGSVPLDPAFRVYKQFGELGSLSNQDILVGYDLQDFVVADGMLCAALVRQDFQAEKIRVLLMTDKFAGLLHEQASVTCDGAFTLSWGEETAQCQPGEVVTLAPGDERLSQGRLTIAPAEEGHTLTLLSLSRNYGSPSYPGTLEIAQEEGGLAIVNEAYLEDYLYRVVPSEMPASYPVEALKAQAVCARSYACRQIKSNSYSQYGAHVDDSTKFQVYNNIEPQEKATRAVNDTYGQVAYYDGEVIMAYYFSTSCGHTSDLGVWGGSLAECPYVAGRYLTLQVKGGDLRNEEEFSAFIKDKEYDTFEKNMPWYRWETVLPASLMDQEFPELGGVTDIRVTQRGEGGVADQVVITGTAGEKVLHYQDEVRQVLGCPELTITKKDGTTATGWKSLPSGYIAIEPEQTESGETAFHIYGGGYGHGAGMSQTAAKVMADMGMDYETILKFFYQGIEVREIAQ